MENLFHDLPDGTPDETLDVLFDDQKVRIERIVSTGQATPEGEWFDQDRDEWVVLLRGAAGLLFQGEDTVHRLEPGAYLHIPAHARHRVEWTSTDEPTVWLAVHWLNTSS
jgi:cupin 2 domain-containing protein